MRCSKLACFYMFLLILRYHQSFSKKKSPELVGLVGGLEHGFNFSIQLGMKNHPNWLSLHHFSEGFGYTTNQWCYPIIIPLLPHYYPIIIPLLSILNHIKTIYPGIIPALKKPPHSPHSPHAEVMGWVLQKWKSLWIDICRPISLIAWDPRLLRWAMVS